MRKIDYESLKSERMQAILRVRAKMLEAVRNWFKRHGYTEVQTPILVPTSQELESSSFKVQYFDEIFHLAQGACPHLEALMISLGRVFTVTPAFRAERSLTKRHLTEFWRVECLDPEFDLEGIMKVQERLIMSISQYLSKEAFEELHVLKRDLPNIKLPFPRITYDDAIKILQRDGINIFWGQEIVAKQEEHLSRKFDKPFFISHYPVGAETLFCKSHPQKTELALVADLLAPEGYGEISSSSQMIDNPEELTKKMKSAKINEKNYEWYPCLKKFISYSYSGFAMGIERLLMWICGLKHIKETILFSESLQFDPL